MMTVIRTNSRTSKDGLHMVKLCMTKISFVKCNNQGISSKMSYHQNGSQHSNQMFIEWKWRRFW